MVPVTRDHVAPTAEEVQRVRVEECRSRGHSFDVVTTFGSLDPQRILCSRCGESWGIAGSAVHVVDILLRDEPSAPRTELVGVYSDPEIAQAMAKQVGPNTGEVLSFELDAGISSDPPTKP